MNKPKILLYALNTFVVISSIIFFVAVTTTAPYTEVMQMISPTLAGVMAFIYGLVLNFATFNTYGTMYDVPYDMDTLVEKSEMVKVISELYFAFLFCLVIRFVSMGFIITSMFIVIAMIGYFMIKEGTNDNISRVKKLRQQVKGLED